MGINCHISFFPVSELGASSGGGDKGQKNSRTRTEDKLKIKQSRGQLKQKSPPEVERGGKLKKSHTMVALGGVSGWRRRIRPLHQKGIF